ncbi:hypothetical protein D0Z00_003915 [Geotrichum galactomycetum]|uniref:Uncharacterized protein n=1 Tax=Geotrichum galactomycetum TaxID=27317 RepID=A0ACB6UZV8_9ASCO|nr:hypothetical protein D0Z00_003915 [Geotrichum candidum]
MSFLKKECFVTDAHHPRANRQSIINEDDRLQLAYCIYSDPRLPTTTIGNPHEKINLLFLHGSTFSKEVWEYTIELFFNKYGSAIGTVIAIDAVNHAASYELNKGKLGWVCTWEDIGKDAVKVLRDLNLKGGTIIIGHSMGGAAALHAAIVEKALIDSIVSIEPVCYADRKAFYSNKDVRNAYYKLLHAVHRSIRDTFDSEQQYLEFMRKKSFISTLHPRVLDALLANNTIVDPKTGVTRYKTPKNMQVTAYASSIMSTLYLPESVKAIDCEVLHIIGSKATWNPPEAAPALRKGLLFGTAVDIENGQHLVPLEMPDETFAAMLPFIDKRLRRIQELAKEEHSANPTTPEAREEYYWRGVAEADKLFTSGQKLIYSRL